MDDKEYRTNADKAKWASEYDYWRGFLQAKLGKKLKHIVISPKTYESYAEGVKQNADKNI